MARFVAKDPIKVPCIIDPAIFTLSLANSALCWKMTSGNDLYVRALGHTASVVLVEAEHMASNWVKNVYHENGLMLLSKSAAFKSITCIALSALCDFIVPNNSNGFMIKLGKDVVMACFLQFLYRRLDGRQYRDKQGLDYDHYQNSGITLGYSLLGASINVGQNYAAHKLQTCVSSALGIPPEKHELMIRVIIKCSNYLLYSKVIHPITQSFELTQELAVA